MDSKVTYLKEFYGRNNGALLTVGKKMVPVKFCKMMAEGVGYEQHWKISQNSWEVNQLKQSRRTMAI